MSDPNLPEGITQKDIDRSTEPMQSDGDHVCPCDGSCKDVIKLYEAALLDLRNAVNEIQAIMAFRRFDKK